MKHLNLILVIVMLALLLGTPWTSGGIEAQSLADAAALPAAPTRQQLTPHQDSYCRYSEPDLGHNNQSLSTARNNFGTAQDIEIAFLTYLLPPLSSLTAVTLTTKAIVAAPNASVGLYSVTDDSWNEELVNWNNQPPLQNLLDEQIMIAGQTDISFNSAALLSYLQNEAAGDGKATFALKITLPSSDPFLDVAVFEDRENSNGGEAFPAQLILESSPVTPTLTAVTPNFGSRGATINISMTGANTHWDMTSILDAGSGILATLNVIDSTHATAQLIISDTAPLGSRAFTITTGSEIVVAPNIFTVQGQGISVAFPLSATGVPSSSIDLPIWIKNDITGQRVYSWDSTIDFNSTVLRFRNFKKAGTLSSNWIVTSNLSLPGQIRLSAYGTEPMIGQGTLITLTFDILGTPGAVSPLTFESFEFNEGHPAVALTNGLFTVGEARGRIEGRFTDIIDRPILGVTVSLSGASLQTVTVDTGGYYAFSPTLGLDYRVTPSKVTSTTGAVSGLDAAWILQFSVGRRDFNAHQQQACDVSGNGSCTPYDASQIGRYLTGNPDPTARIGFWNFTPAFRDYPQFSANLLQENYIVYILGDVTGNGNGTATLARTAEKASLSVHLPSFLTAIGQSIMLPVFMGTVGEKENILSYEITFRFNPEVVQFEDISTEGTLSGTDNWIVVHNVITPGQLSIVGYGIDALQGNTPLLNLNFRSIGASGSATDLTFETLKFNEGTPAAQTTPGRIQIVTTQIYLPIIRR